ncbi:DUF4079 domain-containing protein [Leptolyngbya sp. FACHB-261]|uniref:DUF4079 domain-containing protein n=1 Tax=Leptolyngbya sp. FACHB-261 TaxID=2692806 RepID=UPI001687EAFB|nr:DUF4079 domain-containing protein [Leptolyngbya sp. FACHB-261]MBD2102104.1 DUF4079 domain-containing protein [Leptolyngbya sp. FACHB-261]
MVIWQWLVEKVFNFQLLNPEDVFALIHPLFVMLTVLPMLGLVVSMSLQVRQRRLATQAKEKTKIPPIVGATHVESGKLLAASVIAAYLLAVIYSLVEGKTFQENLSYRGIVSALIVGTIAVFILLYRAQTALWRIVFASLASAGIVVLGLQPDLWVEGHLYAGMTVSILMICSLVMAPEVYRDQRWRRAHWILNTIAVLLFAFQVVTGARILVEKPLAWQSPAVYQCNFDPTSPQYKTCPVPQ